jgi:hypothetical protein
MFRNLLALTHHLLTCHKGTLRIQTFRQNLFLRHGHQILHEVEIAEFVHQDLELLLLRLDQLLSFLLAASGQGKQRRRILERLTEIGQEVNVGGNHDHLLVFVFPDLKLLDNY